MGSPFKRDRPSVVVTVDGSVVFAWKKGEVGFVWGYCKVQCIQPTEHRGRSKIEIVLSRAEGSDEDDDVLLHQRA